LNQTFLPQSSYLSAAFGRKQTIDATLSNMLGDDDYSGGQRSVSGNKNVIHSFDSYS
jgi:hypothetical protein